MPLIARPAAGQIVDPAWGTLVADAVVMRFATAAQRASQLPAPVTGQLTELDNRLGVLQYWSGAAWVDTTPFVQMGFVNPTTNASGDFTLTYPVAVAAGTYVPLLQNATANTSLMFTIQSSTTTAAVIRAFVGTTGAPHANQAIGVLWVLIGSRVAPA